MRQYAVIGSNASGSSSKTLLGLTGASTIQPGIFDLTVGCSATPADQAVKFGVLRSTTAGTSTAYTPLPLLPADVAAQTVAGNAHSVEPTYTAGGTLLSISMNQRATYRWVCADGKELFGAATASNGLGLQLISATAAMVLDGVVHFRE